MNDGIDFDLISPTALTRPEVCYACLNSDDAEDYFGRLNFTEPGKDWPVQSCPMHKMALKEGTLTPDQVRLVAR